MILGDFYHGRFPTLAVQILAVQILAVQILAVQILTVQILTVQVLTVQDLIVQILTGNRGSYSNNFACIARANCASCSNIFLSFACMGTFSSNNSVCMTVPKSASISSTLLNFTYYRGTDYHGEYCRRARLPTIFTMVISTTVTGRGKFYYSKFRVEFTIV
jgi:hypothetical protein